MELPKEIESHLQKLMASSSGDWTEDPQAFENIKALWEEKDRLFSEQIRLLKMEEVNAVNEQDPRAMLIMTFSGSLLSLGYGDSKWMEYASIKLRGDVPDMLRAEGVSIGSGVKVGSALGLAGGPIKSTSALHKIALCPQGVSIMEQEKRVREATVFLTNSFMHLNRELTLSKENEVEQFTKKNIISYLAKKNGLSQDKMRDILDDYAYLMESGLVLGKAVPFGRLGKFALKLKPKRKARVGRNPQTGAEVTIPAKDEHYVPAFRFSKTIKDRVLEVPVKK